MEPCGTQQIDECSYKECKTFGCALRQENRIVRSDKYHITIDHASVVANEEQERRIRELDPDALRRFKAVLGLGG